MASHPNRLALVIGVAEAYNDSTHLDAIRSS
jgi:hypothetical protein